MVILNRIYTRTGDGAKLESVTVHVYPNWIHEL